MAILKSESRKGTPVRWIAIHTNEGSNDLTLPDRTAENLAKWIDSENAAGRHKSYHDIIDDDSVVHYVPDDQAAWALPYGGNLPALQICLTGWARWSRREWLDHLPMLRLAAVETAAKARRWNIPTRKITAAQVAAGERGVIGHVDWTNSGKGRGTHTDPGPQFPWDVFMELVNGEDMATPAEVWGYVIPDFYIGPKGEKATPKTAQDLLSWAATHAAFAKEQAIAARAEASACRLAIVELAGEANLDVDRLVQLMDERFRSALADGLIEVDITVKDNTL